MMPRFRSLSTNSPLEAGGSAPISLPSSPALLTRGFRSLRRHHRRPSHSDPSSPVQRPQPHSFGGSEDDHPLSHTPERHPIVDLSSSTCSSSSPPSAHIRLVPNVGLGTRCFVFEVIERDLQHGTLLKIGRYSDRNAMADRLSFKSKVISRSHAELWMEDGKIYLRDVGSSSGTFVNRARLSPAGVKSSAHEIKDGDIIQLGVDYQGGLEPMYRAVRMRLEVNRGSSVSQPFSRAAFQQLRHHLLAAGSNETSDNTTDENQQKNTTSSSTSDTAKVDPSDIQECCICLYAIAPGQALFIAPCSHIFHFKCLRPLLLENYPGFCCPLCRAYSDLEANVAVEVNEVLESLGLSFTTEKKREEPCSAIPEEEELEQQAPPTTGIVTSQAAVLVPRSGNHASTADGIFSTTLVATPPTFEDILGATTGTSSLD